MVLKLELVTGPTELPITMAEVESYLKVEGAEAESMAPELAGILQSVILQLQSYSGLAFITQTWRVFYDFWPFVRNELVIPYPAPLQSVTHIKTYDDSDTEATWAASNYYVDTISRPGRILMRLTSTSPVVALPRVGNFVEVEFVAGFGARNSVPEDIKLAIMRLCAERVTNHGDDMAARHLPRDVRALMSKYKTQWFF